MTPIIHNTRYTAKDFLIVFLCLMMSACAGQVKEKSISDHPEKEVSAPPATAIPHTTFPQIHTNLNGLVREFVRTMHQDKKGNYWFGTNGDGIIRYDGHTLEKLTVEGVHPNFRVLEIVEDQSGDLWFGTSEGLLHYDGRTFRVIAMPGIQEEIWALTIDHNGLIWIGATGGVRCFDGKKLVPFDLPDEMVENPQSMMSHRLVFKIIEDRNGTMWFATDGNGIFTYRNGTFAHLTASNGLSDNNTSSLFEDRQGNIWIGTFYGGVSKFDGKTYTHFTKEGTIEGIEAGGFHEDRAGNIWFTAEHEGVYKYDGTTFTLYTTKNGLTSNVVLSISEDHKGQLWFGTWQGLCIFDGGQFVNANEKEPWTKG
jgi:ligand-binding sensor domain-containing protein